MKSNIKIIVCAHKKVLLPKHEFFFPVQVGTDIANEKLPYTPDNTGDNISIKNKNYCELTAHYWAWKNLKGTDIIGLNHYRRFFDFYRRQKALSPDRSFIAADDFFRKGYRFPDLENVLNKYDIILGKTRNHPYNIATQYCVFHIMNDWITLKNVIAELTPDYIPAFEETMEKSNSMSCYNMFITSWKHFDGYSEWLFKILFEMEKRIILSPYEDQARIFGYLSERLINVYCKRHHLKIKHYPIIMLLDECKRGYNPSNIRYTYRRIKNNISYFFNK
ncbi:DUF4422 domain-containing protein [Bacteroides sp. 224]|uniref:DUF4422 domain-containing protein n=1 Tax=Bacteroides sp. 224 TaxID=2302936 RepID=UPI0013D37F3D|nr:DUF4422 domain-containing protein [Bacteroides sp. 224]NDV65187.1 DUF4422 domain-containing protein [Bacteroides sp. 224]